MRGGGRRRGQRRDVPGGFSRLDGGLGQRRKLARSFWCPSLRWRERRRFCHSVSAASGDSVRVGWPRRGDTTGPAPRRRGAVIVGAPNTPRELFAAKPPLPNAPSCLAERWSSFRLARRAPV